MSIRPSTVPYTHTNKPHPGNAIKSANWAVGCFVIGSMASYEWCQYLRRCERRTMKRQIEVVAETRRDQQKKMIEERREVLRLEAERKAAEKPWYKFW
jgi:cytochrome c oxidase assembly protein subunit 20